MSETVCSLSWRSSPWTRHVLTVQGQEALYTIHGLFGTHRQQIPLAALDPRERIVTYFQGMALGLGAFCAMAALLCVTLVAADPKLGVLAKVLLGTIGSGWGVLAFLGFRAFFR